MVAHLDEQQAKIDERVDAKQSILETYGVKLETIIEALIFASPEPISAQRIRVIINSKGWEILTNEVKEVIKSLKSRWNNETREIGQGMQLVDIAGGLVFRTNKNCSTFVQELITQKPQKLSPAQLETLAIVAYKQPLTRLDIEDVRSVDCSGSLRRLLHFKLVKIMGKGEGMGRPLLYGTTKQFLEFFGLNSLNDLPTLREYHEIAGEIQSGPKDGDNEIISVADLFKEGDEILSKATQKLSNEALEGLEEALGVVKNMAKKITMENKNLEEKNEEQKKDSD